MTEQKQHLQFPCLFPIKILGDKRPGFLDDVNGCTLEFCPDYDKSTTTVRPSSGGKYEAFTVTVTATSQEQLDNLYRALGKLRGVKFIL